MLSIKVKKPKPRAWRLAFATLDHVMSEQLTPGARVVRLADDMHGTVRAQETTSNVTVDWDDGTMTHVALAGVSKALRVVDEPAPVKRQAPAQPALRPARAQTVKAEADVDDLAADVDKLVEAAVKAELIDEDDATIRTVELADDEKGRRALAAKVLAATRRQPAEEQQSTPAERPSACDIALAKLHETRAGGGHDLLTADLDDDFGGGPRDLSMIAGDSTLDLNTPPPFDLDKGLGDEMANILAQSMGMDVESEVEPPSAPVAQRQASTQKRSTWQPPAPPVKPSVVGTSMEGITGPRKPLVIEDTSAYPPTLKDMLANLDWSGTPKQGAGR